MVCRFVCLFRNMKTIFTYIHTLFYIVLKRLLKLYNLTKIFKLLGHIDLFEGMDIGKLMIWFVLIHETNLTLFLTVTRIKKSTVIKLNTTLFQTKYGTKNLNIVRRK